MRQVSSRVERLGEPVVTGYRSKFFRHNCDDSGCFFQSLPSWDEFIEQFPRGIRPTDVDGLVEINDSFLFLEQKGAGVPMPQGQFHAFKRLASRPRVTVVIFRPAAHDDFYEVMVLPRPAEWETVTADEFKARLSRWAMRADSRGKAA